jgi:hypothetical protein
MSANGKEIFIKFLNIAQKNNFTAGMMSSHPPQL